MGFPLINSFAKIVINNIIVMKIIVAIVEIIMVIFLKRKQTGMRKISNIAVNRDYKK